MITQDEAGAIPVIESIIIWGIIYFGGKAIYFLKTNACVFVFYCCVNKLPKADSLTVL